MTIEMIPTSVGAVARSWDEQHLDLHAASVQIGEAPVAGFSAPVAAVAARFVRAWERHAEIAALRCEDQADGLRTTMADWIARDQASLGSMLALQGYLEELR